MTFRGTSHWSLGVVTVGLTAAARVVRDAAGLRGIRLMLWRIPVGRPFPDVADHVVQPVAIFGGNALTGEVRSKPSALAFWRGNSPCQVFAM